MPIKFKMTYLFPQHFHFLRIDTLNIAVFFSENWDCGRRENEEDEEDEAGRRNEESFSHGYNAHPLLTKPRIYAFAHKTKDLCLCLQEPRLYIYISNGSFSIR